MSVSNNEEFIRKITIKQIQKLNAYLSLKRKVALDSALLLTLQDKKEKLQTALLNIKNDRKESEMSDLLKFVTSLETNLKNQNFRLKLKNANNTSALQEEVDTFFEDIRISNNQNNLVHVETNRVAIKSGKRKEKFCCTQPLNFCCRCCCILCLF